MVAGRAVGVEAVGPAGPIELRADRVVLSAGAIESAHLLLLSGIGPAHELRALGITTAADLPVGRRSWDHPEWVLTTNWPAAVGHPVLEAVLIADGLGIHSYSTEFAAIAGAKDAGPDAPRIGVALMRSRAHGRVSLVSADPAMAPRIEHRYDSEPDDLADLRHDCELVTEIVRGTTPLGTPDWSTSQHLCGTAPMGTEADAHAVVDPQCRVRGVSGLWVVDGSVLAKTPGRGPHATVTMIGHRAAEFVR